MTFWERFYELCLENNTKPNPVASKLGISSGTVSRWKNGNEPSTKALNSLADYFGCSMDYLAGKTDIRKEQVHREGKPASLELKKLIDESSSLSDDEVRKTREYVEFLKFKRNYKSK